jgi:hypothetical protein
MIVVAQLLGLAAFLLVIGFFAFIIGYAAGERSVQDDAVQKGLASWKGRRKHDFTWSDLPDDVDDVIEAQKSVKINQIDSVDDVLKKSRRSIESDISFLEADGDQVKGIKGLEESLEDGFNQIESEIGNLERWGEEWKEAYENLFEEIKNLRKGVEL